MFRYITVAAAKKVKGHSEGWLGKGDHKNIIET